MTLLYSLERLISFVLIVMCHVTLTHYNLFPVSLSCSLLIALMLTLADLCVGYLKMSLHLRHQLSPKQRSLWPNLSPKPSLNPRLNRSLSLSLSQNLNLNRRLNHQPKLNRSLKLNQWQWRSQ